MLGILCLCNVFTWRGGGCLLWPPPPPPTLPNSTPLSVLIVSSTRNDVLRIYGMNRWILSYFSAPGLEFNFLSLIYVWWIVAEHWTSDLFPLPKAGSTYRQCQKNMRSRIELKYLTECFRHILLFDNLWRNAIPCDLRLA